jgi:hypothetical protein
MWDIYVCAAPGSCHLLGGSETSIEGTLPGAAVDEFVAHFTLLQRLIIFILYNKGYPILKYKW